MSAYFHSYLCGRKAAEWLINMKESCMDETKEDSLWIYCPVCGGKTRTKVCKETVLVKFPLYCPKCKKEIKIDVVQLKIVVSE